MRKKRILLIDDELSFNRVLKLNLEETGAYEVRTKKKGTEALAAAREFKPDLILLDVVMPDISGGEVALQIEADPDLKNTRIVFLTATAVKDYEGIVASRDLIRKPATVEEIIECIEKNLSLSV